MIKSYVSAALTGLILAACPVALAESIDLSYPDGNAPRFNTNNVCQRVSYPQDGAPPIHCVSPDWVGVIRPGRARHVPAWGRGADVQCYRAHTGTSYRQRLDDPAGPYWVARSGRSVAGFDRTNNDFINWTKSTIICASWHTA